MRADIYPDRIGWLRKLDYRKLIIIAFLSRVIFASGYEMLVSFTGQEVLLPDGVYYSAAGRRLALLLNGYDRTSFTADMVPKRPAEREVFYNILRNEQDTFRLYLNENRVYAIAVGLIYFIFGYFPVFVRVFNISLSVASAYFLFKVARRHFGELTANLFLIAALFLPTQVGYSLTLSRDFVRMFVVSITLWVIYA